MSDTPKITWPGWETVNLIGRGSFGAVYEIQRDVFGDVEKAALKVISIPQNDSDIDEMYSDGYDEESITSTFQSHLKSIVAEYSMMRKMSGCVNIVACDDVRYVQHDDGFGWDVFIKMELLTPLAKALPTDAPEESVIRIAKDMCTALDLCRKHNIVHRDIKPQNIFVSQNGDYKLGDFGIAKTVEKTIGGTKIGTYKYMAPEVYNNHPYGASADIYSLGLVLYWLLNERRMPFLPLPPAKLTAGAEEQARNRRLSGEPLPPPAHGSDKLKRIVLKACAPNPKDRYHSAEEMLQTLQNMTDREELRWKQEQEERERQRKAQEQLRAAQAAEQERQRQLAELQRQQEWEAAWRQREQIQQTSAKKGKKPWVFSTLACVVLIVTLVTLILGKIADRSDSVQDADDSAMHENHTWIDATCTQPKTCEVCGEVEGEALGHDWLEATYEAPMTCRTCGETSGEPLYNGQLSNDTQTVNTESDGAASSAQHDHIWLDATCTQPVRCESCGETQGEAMGHTWTAATFTAAQTCTVCGYAEGSPIDYQSISVESEVLLIREQYNAIMSNRDAGSYRTESLRDGVDAYYDANGELACVVAYRGTDGIGNYSADYSRSYYFSDGKLFFAFFEGADSHRLYFYDELLMRWHYTDSSGNVTIYDFTFSEAYYLWESLALTEIAAFG